MSQHIEDTRLKSIDDLPEFADHSSLEFIWLVTNENSDYWSIVTLKDRTPVFREMAYSCDGKYFSHSKNHYQEVCDWLKKKYGKLFKNIELHFSNYDCGCYFQD